MPFDLANKRNIDFKRFDLIVDSQRNKNRKLLADESLEQFYEDNIKFDGLVSYSKLPLSTSYI